MKFEILVFLIGVTLIVSQKTTRSICEEIVKVNTVDQEFKQQIDNNFESMKNDSK